MAKRLQLLKTTDFSSSELSLYAFNRRHFKFQNSMLDVNRCCNKAYRNLNFMETWYVNSEKYMLATILALSFIKSFLVQHKCNITDCMHGS